MSYHSWRKVPTVGSSTPIFAVLEVRREGQRIYHELDHPLITQNPMEQETLITYDRDFEGKSE